MMLRLLIKITILYTQKRNLSYSSKLKFYTFWHLFGDKRELLAFSLKWRQAVSVIR
jgi:hypothetical protein